MTSSQLWQHCVVSDVLTMAPGKSAGCCWWSKHQTCYPRQHPPSWLLLRTQVAYTIVFCAWPTGLPMLFLDVCLVSQLSKFPMQSPSRSIASKQRARDEAFIEAEKATIFSSAVTQNPHPEQDSWLQQQRVKLQMVPISACGLLVNDESVRVSQCLRLCWALCHAQLYARVHELQSTALNRTPTWTCKRNAVRIRRHTFINGLFCTELRSAVKEPRGL